MSVKRDNQKPNVFKRSIVALSLISVGVLVIPVLIPTKPVGAAPVNSLSVSPYATTSPHWAHINVLDFARSARAIANSTIRNQAYAWLTSHVDVMETSMDNSFGGSGDTLSTYLHSLNPTLKTFGYDYDLTMCQKAGCNQASPTPHPIFSNYPEDHFLHFSEDTQVEFHDLAGQTIETVAITGCPDPQAISATCRVQLFIWTQKRWVSNLKNTTWRTTTADRFVQETQTNSLSQANVVDGLFIDEHGPGFSVPLGIGGQTRILSGGGIREYNGLRPDPSIFPSYPALDGQYSSDMSAWLAYLQTRLAAVGKFAHINVAEYFTDPFSVATSVAMKGAMTEHINKPDSNGIIRATRYVNLLDGVKQVVQAGGTVDLSGSWCPTVPSGYTAGNYPTPYERYRMWSLASYYLAKEAVGDPGKVYFDPNLCIDQNAVDPLDFETKEWYPAYEYNVGLPTATYIVAAQGTLACDGLGYKIFSRTYEHALILVRVKDGFACSTYDDTTAISVPLSEPMVMLKADGTHSAPMNTVSIRNAEAVILYPAPDETAPGVVNDLVAQ